MNVSRPLVALAATGALLLSGCGSTTLTAAEQVPGLKSSLASVDSALEHHRYSTARAGLGRLITEARAGERDGNLSAAAAARIIHAARVLLAQLPHATAVGIPLRPAIATLDRAALRAEARARFGLRDDAPVLMVTGGSQGAQAINRAVAGAAEELRAAGVQVLHVVGP